MPSTIVNKANQTSADMAQSAVLLRIEARRARIAAATAKLEAAPSKRPQSAGPRHPGTPPVKPRFTLARAAVRQPEPTIRDRSPKPVMTPKSILKSTTTAAKPVPACAAEPDLEGNGLARASEEVYAAPWRSLPCKEWSNADLPIERSAQSETPRELRPCEIQFLPGHRVRRVSRWIKTRIN